MPDDLYGWVKQFDGNYEGKTAKISSISELKGKVVNKVYRNEHLDVLGFELDDGTLHTFQTEGDCCAQCWFEHVDNFDEIVGFPVVDVQEMDRTSFEFDSCDTIDYNFVYFVGKRGVASIEFRTSHNGYYNGCIESCPWEYLYLSQRTNFSRTTNRVNPVVLAEVKL
jgi:hypothetical protein